MVGKLALVCCLGGCDYILLSENTVLDANIDAPFDPAACPSSHAVALPAGSSSRYLLVTDLGSFAQQRALCISLGSHLAIIESVVEAQGLEDASGGSGQRIIGLVQASNQASTTSGWSWITGAPLATDAPWTLGQPNDNLVLGGDGIENNEQNFAQLDFDAGFGFFEDIAADTQSGAICECDGKPPQ